MVLGCEHCHEELLDGGMPIELNVTSALIHDGSQQHGAMILNTALDRVIRMRTMLRPSRSALLTDGGTRHLNSKRFAAETRHPVVVVSAEREEITLFLGDDEYELRTYEELIRRTGWYLSALRELDSDLTERSSELARVRAGLEAHLTELGREADVFRFQRTAIMESLAKRRLSLAVADVRAIDLRPLSVVHGDTGHPSTAIVDREDYVRDLRDLVVNGPWGVSVLRGTRGIGKTRIADETLEKLRNDGVRVARHRADATNRLDVATFIDYVEGGPDPSRDSGRSSLVRLETALGRIVAPVVVMIDSADHLLDPRTNHLMDPQLDEALEMIADTSEHLLTVLLVTQADPVSPSGGTWSAPGRQITVDQLSQEHFRDYLRTLEPAGRWDLDRLTAENWAALHKRWQGNPRLGELAHAVVVVADSRFDPVTLADHLSRFKASNVLTELMHLLVESVTTSQRAVLRALAAFGTAVPSSLVVNLVESATAAEVEEALSTLARHRIIYRVAGDHYSLPEEDAVLVLRHKDQPPASTMYLRAAMLLKSQFVAVPRNVHELRAHFAALEARLLADAPSSAYEVVESINGVVREWNAEHLLLDSRERLRAALDDHHLRKANLNALGIIHLSAQRYQEASDCLREAQGMALEANDGLSVAKIYNNLGTLEWECHDMTMALTYYEMGREGAEECQSLSTQLEALEGIASCHRRLGRYDLALHAAEKITDIRERPGFPETDGSPMFLSNTVSAALRLARWHSELGNSERAGHFLNMAETDARRHPLGLLRAATLDGRAEVQLYLDDPESAKVSANMAIDLALDQRDPVVLAQARTTLCFVYLTMGQPSAARREIGLVWPSQRRHQALMVLALRALTAHLTGDTREARTQFEALRDESAGRVKHNGDDFAAWLLLGYALCGLNFTAPDDISAALVAFQAGLRPDIPALPGFLGRLRYMIEQLGHPEALKPALDML